METGFGSVQVTFLMLGFIARISPRRLLLSCFPSSNMSKFTEATAEISTQQAFKPSSDLARGPAHALRACIRNPGQEPQLFSSAPC